MLTGRHPQSLLHCHCFPWGPCPSLLRPHCGRGGEKSTPPAVTGQKTPRAAAQGSLPLASLTCSPQTSGLGPPASCGLDPSGLLVNP